MKSDTCPETVIPSHGRGRRFDPFSAHHLTGVSEASPGNPEQQQAEQSKSRRGEDVEPRSAPVLDIPTTPREFNRWLNAQDWTVWPIDLTLAAMRALMALQNQQDERFAEQWKADFLFRRQAKLDWSAFTTAYADHVGARS